MMINVGGQQGKRYSKKVFLQKDELIMPIRSQKTERKSNEAVKKID